MQHRQLHPWLGFFRADSSGISTWQMVVWRLEKVIDRHFPIVVENGFVDSTTMPLRASLSNDKSHCLVSFHARHDRAPTQDLESCRNWRILFPDECEAVRGNRLLPVHQPCEHELQIL